MPSVGPVSAATGILTALFCGFLYPRHPTTCKLAGYLGERLSAEFIAPVVESPASSPKTESCGSPCSEPGCKPEVVVDSIYILAGVAVGLTLGLILSGIIWSCFLRDGKTRQWRSYATLTHESGEVRALPQRPLDVRGLRRGRGTMA